MTDQGPQTPKMERCAVLLGPSWHCVLPARHDGYCNVAPTPSPVAKEEAEPTAERLYGGARGGGKSVERYIIAIEKLQAENEELRRQGELNHKSLTEMIHAANDVYCIELEKSEELRAEITSLRSQLEDEKAATAANLDSARRYLDRSNELLEQLSEAEKARDRAIARDTQDYPTAWAYEAVCAARMKWQDRAEAAESRIKELEGGGVEWRDYLRESDKLVVKWIKRAEAAESRLQTIEAETLKRGAEIVAGFRMSMSMGLSPQVLQNNEIVESIEKTILSLIPATGTKE